MLSILKRPIHAFGRAYSRTVNRREHASQRFNGINERSVEYRFVFQQLTRIFPESVLDVGTGRSALPSLMRTCGFLVTAIDNITDYWPRGMFNPHFHVIDESILAPTLTDRFDFITCVSTLEHIPEHRRAVSNMFSLLRPGGTLVLSFPYNETTYSDNVYALPGSIGADRYPFVTQAFSRAEVDVWLNENRAKIEEQEYWRHFDGEFWTIGKRVIPPLRVSKDERHQISCIALKKAG